MNRVAPTTARSARPSSGLRSYGCKVSFATNLVVGQTFVSVYSDRQECLSYYFSEWGRVPRCSAAIPPVKFW
jgi:hypothetical protein